MNTQMEAPTFITVYSISVANSTVVFMPTSLSYCRVVEVVLILFVIFYCQFNPRNKLIVLWGRLTAWLILIQLIRVSLVVDSLI